MLIEYEGEMYPSLALATVLKSGECRPSPPETAWAFPAIDQLSETTVPVIPTAISSSSTVAPREAMTTVSAADILMASVSPDRLQGRITFVGTSASGLKELHTSPFDPIFPGVEVHATVADNLLQGDFISVPGWSNGLILSLVLVLGVLLSLLVAFRNALTCFFVMLICIAGYGWERNRLFTIRACFCGDGIPDCVGCRRLRLPHRSQIPA